MTDAEKQPFVARRRVRKTRSSVRTADVLSRFLITVCGIGTILAVLGVFLYLVAVVVPLFLPARITDEQRVTVPPNTISKGESPLASAIDEDQLMAWVLSQRGTLTLFRLPRDRNNDKHEDKNTFAGEILEKRELFDGPELTASSRPSIRSFVDETGNKVSQQAIAFGFQDGTIRIGTLQFKSSYPEGDTLPRDLQDLQVGQVARVGTGLVKFTKQKQFHLQELVVDLPEPARPPSPSPVRLLDQTLSPTGPVLCVLTADGKLRLNRIKEQKPLDPDLPTLRRLVGQELPFAAVDANPPPDNLLLSEEADQLFLIWETGRFVRYDLRDSAKATVAERGTLFIQEGVKVTVLRQLLGRTTLLVGDSKGAVSAFFLIKPEKAGTLDGALLVPGHRLEGPGNAAVTAIDISSRGRMVSIGYSNGQVRLFNVTSEKLVAEVKLGADESVLAAILAPRTDGLVALTTAQGRHWRFDPGHPEITFASLFGKVWYEGSEKPVHKWESSSGHDAYEPKFGMVPLIFGTLKATFYSLLFGVPLALLAAIYTSEFMRPRARALIKPTIEMMACLPSVVLGFLAGLVFAEFVEDKVPTILSCFLLVPLTFALMAQLVQLLPERASLVVNRWRFLFFVPSLALGVLAGWLVGPLCERAFFGGDLRRWLEDRDASSAGGWMLLFLPLGMLLTAFLMGGMVTPRLRRLCAARSRIQLALLDFARFCLGCLFSLGFALAASWLVSVLGFDARGTYLGTYSQRNMLITGFAIGFAIIPIIFTIADDALSAVPQHLRSGSLATGATPWQTAVRIVIPTAMSGLFSAIMIGMGRAIGETMIVVMASGNTPVMNWNVFSGSRTLSANIAVEIPDATVDGTDYRVLFVAALLLFLMTFVLNTAAELVRLRFRRRAYHL